MSSVFLCSCPEDQAEAATICHELRRRGLDVWWEGELPREAPWARAVANALDRCRSMVILVSPASVVSDLVRREMKQAIFSERYRDGLFSLIIRPTYAGPWPLRRTKLFHLTENNRDRELASLVQAIQTRAKEPPRRPTQRKRGKPAA